MVLLSTAAKRMAALRRAFPKLVLEQSSDSGLHIGVLVIGLRAQIRENGETTIILEQGRRSVPLMRLSPRGLPHEVLFGVILTGQQARAFVQAMKALDLSDAVALKLIRPHTLSIDLELFDILKGAEVAPDPTSIRDSRVTQLQLAFHTEAVWNSEHGLASCQLVPNFSWQVSRHGRVDLTVHHSAHRTDACKVEVSPDSIIRLTQRRLITREEYELLETALKTLQLNKQRVEAALRQLDVAE